MLFYRAKKVNFKCDKRFLTQDSKMYELNLKFFIEILMAKSCLDY
jgi:hypothetical protein